MHCLNIRAGRLGKEQVRRSERICPLCKQGVEDELHMMMECPAYEQHRARFPELCTKPEQGWTDGEFRERGNGKTKEHWEGYASVLVDCMDTRAQMLEQLNSASATDTSRARERARKVRTQGRGGPPLRVASRVPESHVLDSSD